MKTFILILAVAAAAFAQSPRPQSNPARESQQRSRKLRHVQLNPVESEKIKNEISALAKAWNAGDIAGMSAYAAEDAIFVTSLGATLKGRKELDQHHAELMKNHFAGSHQTLTVRDITFVRPRVALCDVVAEISRYKSLPPGLSVKAGQPLRLLTRYVMTHDTRDWTISATQSTVLRER